MINRKPANPEALRLKMADLCARSEQCEHEIREKLRKKMLPPAEIDKIIDFLIDGKFIDNSRYARSFTNDKVRFSGWGRNKIRMALAYKGIPSSFISEALEGIDEKEYRTSLMKVSTTKAKNLDLNEYDDRAKLYRHLISRGYESSLATKVIAHLKKLRE